MPALVKSKVGSSPGTSGDERTRVWPLRSKYRRNVSRSSAPVMGSVIVSPRLVLDRQADALADDPRHHRRGVAATQEMVAKARGGPRAIAALQRGQAPAGDRAGALELAVFGRACQRRIDERGGHAARPELRTQARRAVAARPPRGDPVAGGRRGGGGAASGGIRHHPGGGGGGRPAPAPARGQPARGPRPAGG